MAEAKTLRETFKMFLGPQRFRKFINNGYLFERLKYWQEQEWAKFIKIHPEFAVSPQEFESIFRICELHGDELLPGIVGVFRGCRDYASWYVEALDTLFKNANDDSISTEGAEYSREHFDVWYCPTCRQVKADWSSKRRQI